MTKRSNISEWLQQQKELNVRKQQKQKQLQDEHNKQRAAAYQKQYYQEHKEYFKQYRLTHSEELKTKQKIYYQEHREYYKQYQQNYKPTTKTEEYNTPTIINNNQQKDLYFKWLGELVYRQQFISGNALYYNKLMQNSILKTLQKL